ncbi:MAG: MotA/TolQ/ExbB proton channel family protein [Desulfobacteraceae bacterium]|nr:MotA/TolQ/ExbB proton channel family protein [Desulfobacteraceae bacterium]
MKPAESFWLFLWFYLYLIHSTEKEVRNLSRYLHALATIGNIAPLLGLLGTVLGMIKAFMVIQEMGGWE